MRADETLLAEQYLRPISLEKAILSVLRPGLPQLEVLEPAEPIVSMARAKLAVEPAFPLAGSSPKL